MKSVLFFLIALPSQWLMAAESAQPSSNFGSSPLSAVSMMQTLLALLLVIVCIVLVGWLLKRSQQFNASANGQLKVLASIALGTKERAVLVQVGDQQLLLGVTANQINTLHTLTSPVNIESPTGVSSEFANKLKQIMQQRGHS